MIMNLRRGPAAYASVAVETGVASADPHGLIVLLYEGAIATVKKARIALDAGDIPAKGAAVSRAIQIIQEGLIISLDDKVGGDLALQLRALYEDLARRLLAANLRNEAAGFDEVVVLLEDLKSAWESIGAEVKSNSSVMAA
jgi:flagellar secretion chaperone FliS